MPLMSLMRFSKIVMSGVLSSTIFDLSHPVCLTEVSNSFKQVHTLHGPPQVPQFMDNKKLADVDGSD